MSRTGEGDGRFAVVRHEPAEEWRQETHSVLDETRDDLLGVVTRGLLSQIDVALDLADELEGADVGDPVRIGERPERRVESAGADCARQRARRLAALAVDERDVGADRGVLRDVAVEAASDLDLVALAGELLDQLAGPQILCVDDGDDLQQLRKGNRDRGGLHGSLLQLGVKSDSGEAARHEGASLAARDRGDVGERADRRGLARGERELTGGLDLGTHRARGELVLGELRRTHFVDRALLRRAEVETHRLRVGRHDEEIRAYLAREELGAPVLVDHGLDSDEPPVRIDAVFYVTGNLYERARLARVGERIRHAETEAAAAALVEEELEELIGTVGDPDERADLHRRVVRHVRASERRSRGVTGGDLRGAVASFWLVFFSSIPAAFPFLVFRDAWVALRVSNAILVCLLFVTGYLWARHTALRPWLAGTTFLVAGVALVSVAVALGG